MKIQIFSLVCIHLGTKYANFQEKIFLEISLKKCLNFSPEKRFMQDVKRMTADLKRELDSVYPQRAKGGKEGTGSAGKKRKRDTRKRI